ncbi:DUF169 domain-containing protein [Mesorhizobium sp. M1380]|uniref:DUF169 domain-containing protein n=1 Tax=Mesorhizobium sp. M1380 TaxID=2957093 RepID=UPI00333BE694
MVSGSDMDVGGNGSASAFRQSGVQLTELLGLSVPPIAITFLDTVPTSIPQLGLPMCEPTSDLRQGIVPAGCVFWTIATGKTFVTTPEEHGNCSVGSVTHGLISLEAAAQKADVQAVCEAGWVTMEAMQQITAIPSRPSAIVYGPLAETQIEPSVILLRLNGKQQMLLHDAWPGIRLEGKPQCHIIAIAKELDQIALSVGCMLSRVRTGMSNNEVTCAVPAGKVQVLIQRLHSAQGADFAVARYAAEDAKRFPSASDRMRRH